MAIQLEKGQRINLEKNDGNRMQNFCVGCNWGAIEEISERRFYGLLPGKKQLRSVDLDLSCVIFDDEGKLCDHIYSPLYREEFLSHFGLPRGKVDSLDGALHHSGDDTNGDSDGDDGLDNEIITVDLQKVDRKISQIFFFLNNCGQEDFSMIPYASIRMYEGTPEKVKSVFAQYNVASSADYKGMKSLIMGKLYRRGSTWKFAAIGDAFDDPHIAATIHRIYHDYAR